MTEFDELHLEAKINLLIHADLPEFGRLCRLNKKNYNICYNSTHSARIFKDKSKLFFSDFLRYKPDEMSWKEFFQRISWLVKKPTNPFSESGASSAANMCALRGKVMELRILSQLDPPQYPNQVGMDSATSNGHIDVLKFIWEEKQKPIPVSDDAVDQAAGRGKLEMLKWLYERDIHSTHAGANAAVMNNQREVVAWLLTLPEDYWPTKSGANTAINRGYEDLVELLYNHGIFPSGTIMAKSFFYNNVIFTEPQVLKAIADYNITLVQRAVRQQNMRPTREWMLLAASRDYLDIVQYLYSLGVPITYETLNIAPGLGRVRHWMFSRNANKYASVGDRLVMTFKSHGEK